MNLRRLRRDWLPPALLILALLVAWEVIVRVAGIAPWLLPPPSAIPGAAIGSAGALANHTLVTLSEVILGMIVSVAFGLAVAAAIVSSPAVERALYPLLVASQTVPVTVIAPLLLIFLGYGIVPKIVLVTLICFFPITVNTVDGLRSVDADAVTLLRTFGATNRQIFAKVRWPAALPFFFSGLRLAATYSVIGAVFGELLGASAGLGYYVRTQTPRFKTAEVYAATFILVLIGVVLFLIVRLIEWIALPWRRATPVQSSRSASSAAQPENLRTFEPSNLPKEAPR
jgi:ABC-type nitrate/sulfonate/bicarbonate transport system permease component